MEILLMTGDSWLETPEVSDSGCSAEKGSDRGTVPSPSKIDEIQTGFPRHFFTEKWISDRGANGRLDDFSAGQRQTIVCNAVLDGAPETNLQADQRQAQAASTWTFITIADGSLPIGFWVTHREESLGSVPAIRIMP